MNSIFDYRRKSDRDCLVDITGTIYLYARKNNLPFVQCVREVGECFLDVQKKPDNNMAINHEGFIAKLSLMVIRFYLLADTGDMSDSSMFFCEIGRIFKTTPEENLNFFASLLDVLKTASEAEKQEIFAQMESINKHIRKFFNNQED